MDKFKKVLKCDETLRGRIKGIKIINTKWYYEVEEGSISNLS